MKNQKNETISIWFGGERRDMRLPNARVLRSRSQRAADANDRVGCGCRTVDRQNDHVGYESDELTDRQDGETRRSTQGPK